LFRVVSLRTPCKPRSDWSFRACNPGARITAENVTAHVAGDNKDTPFISTTDNFLWAIYYAFRATLTTQATAADLSQEEKEVIISFVDSFIVEQIYIYLISNELRYRNCETQLSLASPSNRSEYLRLCDAKPDYVDHKIYRKGKWDYRWDYSRENGEVLVRKEIPSTRVLGRCCYRDINNCGMEWWFDKLVGSSTSVEKAFLKYRDVMGLIRLELGIELFEKIAQSAQRLSSIWFSRDGDTVMVPPESVFDCMIYGLKTGEDGQNASIMTLAKDSWYQISSEAEKMRQVEENPQAREVTESTRKENFGEVDRFDWT